MFNCKHIGVSFLIVWKFGHIFFNVLEINLMKYVHGKYKLILKLLKKKFIKILNNSNESTKKFYIIQTQKI